MRTWAICLFLFGMLLSSNKQFISWTPNSLLIGLDGRHQMNLLDWGAGVDSDRYVYVVLHILKKVHTSGHYGPLSKI